MSEDKFEFHFHAPVGQNIAKVEKMEVHMNKDGTIQVMQAENVEMGSEQPVVSSQKSDDALFKYIHHDIVDDERVRVHKAICNIVRLPKMAQICSALLELIKEKKIYSSIEPALMLAELRRLGMPGENVTGFSDQNFFSYYKTR